MDYYNIPERLRAPKSRVYCVHQDKIPIYGTKPNDLSTFYSFDEAVGMIKDGQGLGIGMWGILCGIDIDHCVEDGKISPIAQQIIDYFDSYAELSYSGTGIHILFLCKEQHKDASAYYTKLPKKQIKEKGIEGLEGLEFYQGLYDHRYLTLTGNKVHDMNVEYVSAYKLNEFLDTYFKRPPVVHKSTISFTSSDREDIAWFNWARAKRPDKLIALAQKTPTGSGGTESEDDLILMTELAFWCNKNPVVMRAAFEGSAYYKKKDAKHIKKWARKDYSEGVINKAIAAGNVAKVYFQEKFYYDETENCIKEVSND